MNQTTEHSSFRHALFYGGPVIAYGALIYYLSSLSRFPEEVPSFFAIDKVAHFFEYYIFGWLTCRWLTHSERFFFQRNFLLLSILLGVSYGLSDEWHQSFVPGRDASLWDAIFDAVGITVAAFTYRFIRKESRVFRRIGKEGHL